MFKAISLKYILISVFVSLLSFNSHSVTQIKVGIDLWPGYYPIIIAQHQGYFAELDLDVSYVLPEETNNLMSMFTEHKIDLLCVAMGDAFTLYDQDPGMKVVMITDESYGGDALLKKGPLPKPGQEIRIGTNLHGFGELFVREFLKQSGYFEEDIVLVQQEASQAMEYLRSKRAHVVHTWEPYVSDISNYYGAEVIFDSSQTPGLIPDALLANAKFIKENPVALKKFIAAWFKGVEWWQENRAIGDQLIEQELLLIPGSLSLKGTKLYTLKDNHMAFTDQDSMKSIKYVAQIYLDFFKSKDKFKRFPNSVNDLVTSRFLPTSSMQYSLTKWFEYY